MPQGKIFRAAVFGPSEKHTFSLMKYFVIKFLLNSFCIADEC